MFRRQATATPPIFPRRQPNRRPHAGYGEQCFAFGVFPPLAISGGGYEAAALRERRPEHPRRGHRLRAGVDRFAGATSETQERQHLVGGGVLGSAILPQSERH
jgi:hypothetical protein